MSTNRSAKKLAALALAGAVIAAGAAGTQARASEHAATRATEASEGQEFYYHPPADARYSSVVFDVFDPQGAGS